MQDMIRNTKKGIQQKLMPYQLIHFVKKKMLMETLEYGPLMQDMTYRSLQSRDRKVMPFDT